MLDIIKKNLQKALEDIRNSPDEIYEEEIDNSYLNTSYEEDNDYNPYEDGPYAGFEFFCIRCGSKLKQIAKDDKYWDYLWGIMEKDGTQYFLCSNKDCCHEGAPLVLHHPIKGYTSPAGDSYSLSWVK